MLLKFQEHMALILEKKWNTVSQEKQILPINLWKFEELKTYKPCWGMDLVKIFSHQTYEIFPTCNINVFFCFKALLALDS